MVNCNNTQENSTTILTAQDIMSSPVRTAKTGWTIRQLIEFFAKYRLGGVAVVDDHDALVGVISLSDIIRFEKLDDAIKEDLIEQACSRFQKSYLSEEVMQNLINHADSNCTVQQIMTQPVITVTTSTPVLSIAKTMKLNHIRRVFVVQDKSVIGVVSNNDLLAVLIDLLDQPLKLG